MPQNVLRIDFKLVFSLWWERTVGLHDDAASTALVDGRAGAQAAQAHGCTGTTGAAPARPVAGRIGSAAILQNVFLILRIN